MKRFASIDAAILVALFVAAFALYARTMAPGLLDGDEGEFQTNIFRLGVSHTGYPLFFLLGKLWTMIIQVGEIATRANLFSVFWGTLTAGALFIFLRWLIGNRWVALIGAGLLIVSRVEWSQAIIPRPYTMNALFVVLVTFFFFLWRAGKVDLIVPVFLFGLSLTNHRTMIWFAPAIALFVLWKERVAIFRPLRLVTLIAAFVVPLLMYGYVFWRGDSDVGVEFHLKDFGEMILGGNASRWMRYGPIDWIIYRITDLYIPLLVEQFTPLGFVAGLVGIIALARNRVPREWQRNLPARQVLLFIALANTGNSIFCVFFNTIDVEKFFLPSYITFLFFSAIGLAVTWDWLADRLSTRLLQAAVQSAFLLMGFGIIAFLIIQNYMRNDFSNRTAVIETWRENLSQPLEQNALIVGPWESLTPLEYAQYVDGRRIDLDRWKVIIEQEQVPLTLYGSRQADIEHQVRAGRPVYMTIHPNDTETLGVLAEEFRLTRVGELWRVLNLPPQATAPSGKPIATFIDRAGQRIEMIAFTIHPATTKRPGDFGLLTLFWRAPQSLSTRLTISLRVVDAQDRIVYQRDAEPGSGLRPVIGWTPGEIVQDDIGFFVPPNVALGKYRLVIVMYNQVSREEWMTPDTIAISIHTTDVTKP